tara:strand:+ start:82473 stop:83903 length:1431 start_codon:yes stop_codon:yes gene_type:complete
MKLKKLAIATAVLSSLGGLYGCSEGDEANINIDAPTTITNPPADGGGGDTGTTSICPDWSSARPKDADGNDVCQLPATILVDRTLTSDKVWYMESRVTVGNGNQEMSIDEGILANGDTVVDATISIQPGTQIKGQTGSFANMIITRGSKIMAEGTADAPIIFSSDDPGFDGVGDWGGLILHGYAPHNECLTADMGAVACNIDSEGESGFGGGYSPDDSSGVLRYVVVAEGGFEFATGNEINGISLIGVGAGTEMEYIQIHNNADDGIEYYGGTVSTRYLVLTGNQDDSIDWDEGWNGNVQYLLAIQGPDASGNLIEADTEGTLDFLSIPTIANATFIGNGANAKAAVFKATSGGFVHHSVFTYDDAFQGETTCVDASRAAQVGTELVYTNVVADCDISGDVVLLPSLVSDVQLDENYASQAPESSAVGALDIEDINATYPVSVADPDFFDVTDYAGAVDPNASSLWYEGWTIPGSL